MTGDGTCELCRHCVLGKEVAVSTVKQPPPLAFRTYVCGIGQGDAGRMTMVDGVRDSFRFQPACAKFQPRTKEKHK